MSIECFEKINKELKYLTKQVAYHVAGDPMVLNNLKEYLDISYENDLKVNIVTTANNLQEKHYDALMHKSIRQINFSINSYNANSHKKTLEEYIYPIVKFVKYAIANKQDFFINFRIWNLDQVKSSFAFNKRVFDIINKEFQIDIDINKVHENKLKNIRLASKVFIHFDEYFSWPSLDGPYVSDTGKCHGLKSQIAILSNGEVVPCCLDLNGHIKLGNAFNESIKDILNNERSLNILESFKKNIVVEELCKHCSYRTRFDKE